MANVTPKLSFDIDGVLADFTGPFTEIVNRQNNLDLCSDWPVYNCFGEGQMMTDKQWNDAWLEYLAIDYVWAKAPKLPFVDLDRIDEMMADNYFNGYFVTYRKNTTAGQFRDATSQTQLWLNNYGVFNYSGIIAGLFDRPTLLKAIGVDAHIDDWGDQFIRLRDAGINCYLIDRPHNQHIEAGDKRVFTVDEYISKALREFDKQDKTLQAV